MVAMPRRCAGQIAAALTVNDPFTWRGTVATIVACFVDVGMVCV